MELRQIRYFLAVAEELHFGKAARKLHVSEQPLSYQIKKFEEELGFKLFERTTRSVKLTPAGEAFAANARKVLELSERTVDIGRRVAAGEAGVVHLGYESSAAPAILSVFIKHFSAAYPDIDLVTTEYGDGALGKLADGMLDACLATRFDRLPQWVDYTPIMRDEAMVALPLDHPLADSESLSLRDLALADIPFLGYVNQGGELANRFMERVAVEYGLTYRRETATHMSLIALVAAGMGFTAMTGSMAKLMQGEVAYVKLADPYVPLSHGLALLRDAHAPARKSLLLAAKSLARDLGRTN